MHGYYGGLASVLIRHTSIPVVYCDFTSQYPTVNALLGIWPLLVAQDLRVQNMTKKIRNLLANLTLEQLLDPDIWLRLGFFALIEPHGDILPVRTCYSETGETNIGRNPLTSKEPIWYAGPDLAAAVLLTGRSPKIIRAIRLVPVGIQNGLVSTVLGDRTIDPSRDNFFTAVIENRKQLSSEHPMYYFLKILANAGGYGMYAELNREQFGKNSSKLIEVYSGEHHFERTVSTVEKPGPWYFPPVASLITAGGRLLLAMLEKMVTDAGGAYMMCDTDSMAIVSTKRSGLVRCEGGPFTRPDGSEAVKALSWQEVGQIASNFAPLNPYDPKIVTEILKIEDYNYDRNGKQRQLFGWAVSAKRYVLFASDGEIIKPSEHGLGPYFHPIKKRYVPPSCQNQDDSYPEWIVEGWRWILGNQLGPKRPRPAWFKFAAMRKVAITTPNVLSRLRRIDRESAKPSNFVISPMLIFGGPTLIAPFCDDPSRWTGLKDGLEYISVEDGTRFRICKPDEDELLWTPGAVGKDSRGQTRYILSSQVRDFDMVFREYTQHPEAKSLAPDGSPCTSTTRGLLRRRPIEAITPFRFIGKEVDRSMQDDLNVFSDVRPIEYRPDGQQQAHKSDILPEGHRYIARVVENNIGKLSTKELARKTGLDRNTIRRWRRGERIQPKTRLRLLKVASS
jgi:hypothetical protein